MKAQQLVSRLLTVPREERARVLAQEGPVSWDSVTFFAVRDGLRDARFHGQMSAADYIDTLEEVERRYEEGANAGAMTSGSRSTGLSTNYRATVEDELDDQTIDLVPPEGDEAVDDESDHRHTGANRAAQARARRSGATHSRRSPVAQTHSHCLDGTACECAPADHPRAGTHADSSKTGTDGVIGTGRCPDAGADSVTGRSLRTGTGIGIGIAHRHRHRKSSL